MQYDDNRNTNKGPFKKYATLFLTKFDPLPPLCHKLSHLAKVNPYQRHVTGHNTNHQPLFYTHYITCGISSLLHSVNLILFTLLLVHLILRISPHHSDHLRYHHVPHPRPFTQTKAHLFHKSSPPSIVFLVLFGLPSQILDVDQT